MKRIARILAIVIVATSCASNQVCECCKHAYTSLESASQCISDHPIIHSTSDNRLFLFAFVDENTKSTQENGWDILADDIIIETRKQDYLLIITDVESILGSQDTYPPEFIDVIQGYNEDLFFLITNQALYPFADWTKDGDKEIILDRLQIGDGP